jgi:hypothetical protein
VVVLDGDQRSGRNSVGRDVGLVDPDMAVLETVSPTARDFDDGESRGSRFSGHEGNGKPNWVRFEGGETKMGSGSV